MKSVINWIAWILVVVGALNWGLIGFFDFNLVTAIVGSSMATIIYDIVGLSAVVLIIFKFVMPKMKKK